MLARPDLVCVSHLRWDFVYQRPQHLLSRAARHRRVLYFEEPVYEPVAAPDARTRIAEDGVQVVVPVLPLDTAPADALNWQRDLLTSTVRQQFEDYVLWFYTPMGLQLTNRLNPIATVYDCMDELSSFKHAAADLPLRELELFRAADLVFTGGHSLYQAKRHLHDSVWLFPSSVDFAHFAAARTIIDDPADQAAIPNPRVGFFGVVDERLDLSLLDEVSRARPDLHFVLIGPVTKIDVGSLPRRPNLHWMGPRSYSVLPQYVGGWQVAMLPFARNEATRFISPTKTPEYLAAGRPVVSTSIRDVVRPYGQLGVVRIADEPADFAAAIDAALAEDPEPRVATADRLLRRMSWDRTWTEMQRLLDEVVARRVRARRSPSVTAMPSVASRRRRSRIQVAAPVSARSGE